MKRHIVQYLATWGTWLDACDIDGMLAVFETYDEAREFQEWAEQGTAAVRVITFTADVDE